MIRLIEGIDKVIAEYSDMGQAATDLMAYGFGYAIWDDDGNEITYEDLMMDK